MPSTNVSINELFQIFREQLELTWLGKHPSNAQQLPLQQAIGTHCPVGYLDLIHPRPIQVIGPAEYDYLSRLGKNSYSDSLEQLCSDTCRLIILCALPDITPALLNTAQQHGIALLQTPRSAGLVIAEMNGYLCSISGEHQIMHGVFLEVLGIGVLLTGASGIGKSELALELISRGQRLIADDAPEFFRGDKGALIGRCPPLLQDFIEVRGLGLLNIRAMFGEDAIRTQKTLQLIIQLNSMDDNNTPQVDRLRGSRHMHTILGCSVPELQLPVAPGRNLAVLVEASTRGQMLYNKGYDPYDDFTTRHRRLMTQQP